MCFHSSCLFHTDQPLVIVREVNNGDELVVVREANIV